MATVQNVIDRARGMGLNDVDKDRYPDDDLLGYLRDGIALAYSMRPDLQFGNYGKPVELLALNDTFPLKAQHEVAVMNYIIACAETRDDEHVNANRETKAFKTFTALIQGT